MAENTTWVLTHIKHMTMNMSVKLLEKHLKLNEEICKSACGNGTLAHRDAVLARMMFEQVLLYAKDKEIEEVSYKDVHKYLLKDLTYDRDEEDNEESEW